MLTTEPNSRNSVCFISLVETAHEAQNARLMVESLRAFGGDYRSSPVWVFAARQSDGELRELSSPENTRLLIMKDNELPSDYLFARKVHACAQAEALSESETLVWLNPECLILNPPLLFDLDDLTAAGFRPVHHINVGSAADQPMDAFWQGIYRAAGMAEAPYAVESFADQQTIRPYFNTHCFSVKRNLGLFTAWQGCFNRLVSDVQFQAEACLDVRHRVFLHQAVLSTLAAKMITRAKLRILPETYSYPLHMHLLIPAERQAKRINNLVCAVYEDEFRYPVSLNGLQAEGEIQAWIRNHV